MALPPKMWPLKCAGIKVRLPGGQRPGAAWLVRDSEPFRTISYDHVGLEPLKHGWVQPGCELIKFLK